MNHKSSSQRHEIQWFDEAKINSGVFQNSTLIHTPSHNVRVINSLHFLVGGLLQNMKHFRKVSHSLVILTDEHGKNMANKTVPYLAVIHSIPLCKHCIISHKMNQETFAVGQNMTHYCSIPVASWSLLSSAPGTVSGCRRHSPVRCTAGPTTRLGRCEHSWHWGTPSGWSACLSHQGTATTQNGKIPLLTTNFLQTQTPSSRFL